jgi:hypothetical protein
MADHYDNGGSGNRTAVTIAAIVGGVIVVFLLVCGGLVYVGLRAFESMKEMVQPMVESIEQMAQSQVIAEAFLAEIRANNLDAAYQSTTEGFKRRMSRQAFEELVQRHPELKQPALPLGPDVNRNPSRPQTQPFSGPYRYRFQVQGKDDKDSVQFTVTVGKENGVLKVDELTLDKKESSK